MSRGRSSRGLKENKIVSIYCEGYTEAHYLEMLKQKHSKKSVTIKCHTVGQGHKALIKYIIKKEKNKPANKRSDKVVAVFDYDNRNVDEIEEALSEAKNHKPKITVLYTNFKFELWLLLHFKPLYGRQNISSKVLDKELEECCDVEKWQNYKNERFYEVEPKFYDKVEDAHINSNSLKYYEIDISENYPPHIITYNPYENFHFYLKSIFNVSKL
ncbi:RloB family protein [Staphylococcus capitis]